MRESTPVSGIVGSEPEHIAISKSKGIKIDWKDGHHSEYALAYLRDECPCATCTGAHGTEPQKIELFGNRRSPFQMYKPTLKMLRVEPWGVTRSASTGRTGTAPGFIPSIICAGSARARNAASPDNRNISGFHKWKNEFGDRNYKKPCDSWPR